eukprot:TRINITY_DN1194_c1_g2_i1.p1 TRINITY_DN1194_c1_g2~~TRINITY_DN1194_c1_g2_i1.p1  ORF type:complete len:525 (+),score=72.92 TRINITY_DN1194_c1_g2_i1:169-1743(+)
MAALSIVHPYDTQHAVIMSNGKRKRGVLSTSDRGDDGVTPDVSQIVTDKDMLDIITCTICHELLHEPRSCRNGHSFCRVCILEWIQTRATCPSCRISINSSTTLSANRTATFMIANADCRCRNFAKVDGASSSATPALSTSSSTSSSSSSSSRRGKSRVNQEPADNNDTSCAWVGKVSAYRDHVASCLFEEVTCANQGCREAGIRRVICGEHAGVCNSRIITCELCPKQVKASSLSFHIARECPNLVIACHNHLRGCEAETARSLLSEHKAICAHQKVACPFSKSAGCKETAMRKDMEQHVATNTSQHLELACSRISHLTSEIAPMKTQMSTLLERLDQMEKSHGKTSRRVSNLMDGMDNHDNQLKDLNTRSNVLDTRATLMDTRITHLREDLNFEVEWTLSAVEKARLAKACYLFTKKMMVLSPTYTFHGFSFHVFFEVKDEKKLGFFAEHVNNKPNKSDDLAWTRLLVKSALSNAAIVVHSNGREGLASWGTSSFVERASRRKLHDAINAWDGSVLLSLCRP